MSVTTSVRRRRLFALAVEQGGYFTAKQAVRVGYSHQAQHYHVAAGNWLRVGRGIFRLADWVPDTHDDLIRWTLWSDGQAVVSHETALTVHDVGELESGRVHLTVPPGFRAKSDAVTLHYAALPSRDVMQRAGFRVTTPLRSLIDVASVASDEDQLSRVIEEAVADGLVTVRRLRSRAEAVDPRAALLVERSLQRLASHDLQDAGGATDRS